MLQGRKYAVLDESPELEGLEVTLYDTAGDAGEEMTKEGALPWLWHYSARDRDWAGPELRDEQGRRYRVVEVDYKNNRIRLFDKGCV